MKRALVALVLAAGCRSDPPRPVGRSSPSPAGFLKGQLHMHTGASADSDTPPERAVAWYAEHGFDFVVITDHNHVTAVPSPTGMLVLRGVELTQNLRICVPPPEPGLACLLHVDALFVAAPPGPVDFPPPFDDAPRRAALYERAVDEAKALGGLAQLNHPNFHYAADLDVVLATAARGATLLEIANEAVDSTNEGDARHPSTEALWDAALSRGAHVFGTATDDAHHYDDAAAVRARGETAYVGDRGWVFVRAARDPAAIRAAIERGDFYASTGVVLDRVDQTREAIAIVSRDEVRFEVVGEGGRVLVSRAGRELSADPRALDARSYVRVRVTDASGHHAWTQPVWLTPIPGGGR